MELKNISNITAEAFSKYGTVIEFTPKMYDGWEILVREEKSGWRIALLEFTRRTTKILESHPTSKESFEPVKGTAILIAAENNAPESFEIFLLDKPVCLNEGIWHQVVSLSEVTQVKITENLEVSCEYYNLPGEITPVISF